MVGVAVVVAYIVIVFGLQYATGLTYDEWTHSGPHLLRAAIIPLSAGVVLLVAFLASARWDREWTSARRRVLPRPAAYRREAARRRSHQPDALKLPPVT